MDADQEAQRIKNQAALALLRQRMAEEPTEEDERWPELKAALEANRAGQRPLFEPVYVPCETCGRLVKDAEAAVSRRALGACRCAGCRERERER